MEKDKISKKERIKNKLIEITKELKVDFSSIALYDALNQEFRWRLAEGSLNNRYTNIVVRRNRGICGMALKTKREFMIRNFPEDLQDDALEYPILIIEELKSSVAVPLIYQNQTFGVLLIGQRTYRDFTQEDIDYTKKIATEILNIYLQEQQVDKQKDEDKKLLEPIPLIRYFSKEKEMKGDLLKVQLLDQRITLLSEKSQNELISIFERLLNWVFSENEKVKVKITIESISEQQFTVLVEMNQKIILPEEKFSSFAARVRKISGSIELTYEEERTLVMMNFLLMPLFEDREWT